ncbi:MULTISPECIES: glycosyltransferase family 4 protein [Okeania]|uniref:Glycosyltransferase n=2 Tax=Okeania hirsuta TaxID=1458930 RepID=A0A3N6RF00_9CYAN|nr:MULTISPECIES: glycosyltransferase family 4 protein [Okeania]NET12341.1 glycosyltransferase family 4 protein [Okeania sp. SIO1H6]NES78794.1 glycosyltransferase family 4 protein [Okeania sp. SIO1H4]NES91455.1 glycosyltransferase family 4 protein [Okeania sp. SIO2B9]NET22304.1 glycosyltransferase family 4 protein [Okeania sp. SIO1H5]NET78909.1 glycosyltransferase family 4 protein [Okeania sp. SIO1F9]
MATAQANLLRLLFASTPVGAIGSGTGGGVEFTLQNIAQEMILRGHKVDIVAPQGSITKVDCPIIEITGELQVSIQQLNRDTPISIIPKSVLTRMWEFIGKEQNNYDLIVNFAYDWLPFYLSLFLNVPIAHLVSMGSLSKAMDEIIEKTSISFPGTIAVHTKAQAETFSFPSRCRVVGNGIDIKNYQYCDRPNNYLVWVARISPEKGLEDAVEAAKNTGIPLKIMGLLQDKSYWESIQQNYPDAPIEYLGFLPIKEMQLVLRRSRGYLMTHRWSEAFGMTAIQSLACGVPIITYNKGGPAEIVRHGQTGWLVEPGNLVELVKAINNLDKLDRLACRQQAEAEYSIQVYGNRMENWFYDILAQTSYSLRS